MKTDNILLTTHGVVKIADLGLSRKLHEPTDSTTCRPKYTNTVVTLWYRAPELLLGDTDYSEKIDLWSFGCIMGEFWNRTPIMRGSNETSQLKLILELCGLIDPEAWPNVIHLKLYNKLKIPGTYARKTRTFLNHGMHNEQANNMFDTLLMYDPSRRHSAWSALNDDFFFTNPLPVQDLSGFMERSVPTLCPGSSWTEQKQLLIKQQQKQPKKKETSKVYLQPKNYPFQYQPKPSQ